MAGHLWYLPMIWNNNIEMAYLYRNRILRVCDDTSCYIEILTKVLGGYYG